MSSASNRERIKNAARHMVAGMVYYSGAAALQYLSRDGRSLRILTYHGVSDSPADPFTLHVSEFRKQMSFLKKRFRVIALREYREIVQRHLPIPHRAVVITFDDGLANFLKYAYPVLKNEELPATCFIVAEKAGSHDDRFMNWREIEQMASEGLIDIGSHSLSHKSMAALAADIIREEALKSKLRIEKELHVGVQAFSYPFGTRRDVNDACMRAVKEAGYRMAVTSVNGLNGRPRDMFRLKRTKIERGDDFRLFKKIMLGALDAWVVIDRFFSFLQNRKGAATALFEKDLA